MFNFIQRYIFFLLHTAYYFWILKFPLETQFSLSYFKGLYTFFPSLLLNIPTWN
jgi:hypothetical protein